MITKLKLKTAGAGWGVEISGYFDVREFDPATSQHTHRKEYALVHYLTPGTIQELYVSNSYALPILISSGPAAERRFIEIVSRGQRPRSPSVI